LKICQSFGRLVDDKPIAAGVFDSYFFARRFAKLASTYFEMAADFMQRGAVEQAV